ncbi:MAG: selenium metabolism-associated LysR family transcriptional regulator [Bacillota bacterium]
MNLNLFITFVRVIEKKSLSGAARDLFLTQPAVSKQIQTLEELYGVQLMERVGRRIRLTEAGEIFYQHALEILGILEELNDDLIRTTAGVRGRLLIGASTVPGHYILPSFIGRYKRQYPEVKVSLEIGDTGSVVNSLLEQRVDLAVVGATVKNHKLVSTLFADDRLRLIVPAAHPLATRTSIQIEEIVQENLIWREKGSGTRRVLEDRLADQGVNLDKLNILLELGSTEAVITAVEEGLGIALVSQWAIGKSTALGRIASPELEGIDLKRNLYLIYRRQKIYSRAMQAFLDLSKLDLSKN